MSEADFKLALQFVTTSTNAKLSNDTKLKFYGLYKQITDGPCRTSAPSRLNLIARTKWDAWNKLGKMSKEEAMKQYVDALTNAVPTWRTSLSSKL